MMIVTRTPVRVSFLGGGTDYLEYYRLYGGQILAVAIDKYSYITVNPLAQLFDHSIRVSYSKTELTKGVDEIKHPSVRECLRLLKLAGRVEIHYVGDLPARTGLGSSSSFTVGLLHALHALKGELVDRERLAKEAVYVERELIGERVGVQDQFVCALGGLLHLRIDRDGDVRASAVPLHRERLAELRSHLMLFYTGVRRDAHEILEEQLSRTAKREIDEQLGQLGGLVEEGLRLLSSEEPIVGFGELLDQAWRAKRELSSRISSPAIDDLYQRAIRAGAAGGKLLGAGGGGFLLLLASPSRQRSVEAALVGCPRIEFGFDHQGTSLVFYDARSSAE